jgi:hypothetical protein
MKHFVRILISVFLCGIFSSAQAQTFPWAKCNQGTGSDEGWDIATDDSGNVYVTGFFQSPTSVFGSDTLINASGAQDLFLVKYDSTGNVIWARGAGGANSEYAEGVATDDSGNVFITGAFQSATITFGSITLTNVGGSDVFIVKYNSAGNVIWAQGSTSSGGSDFGYSCATDHSGNVYITGMINSSTIHFGSFTLNGAGGTDMFIVKYDGNGNVIWAKTPGAPFFDRGMDIATDDSGNVFVVGHFASGSIHFGTITLFNYSTNVDNVFLVKYNSAGTALWAKGSYAAGANYGWGVATDHSGNCYITGRYSYSPMIIFDTDTLFNAVPGNAEVFIVKYNGSGIIQWAKNGNGPGVDFGYGLATDSAGNVYLTGAYSLQSNSTPITFGSFTLPTASPGMDAMFIVKYEKGGNVVCATALTGGGDDNNGIAINSSNDIYVGGDFMVNPFVVGTTTLALTGNENVFLAKYVPCDVTLSSNDQTNENEPKIYPNPSNGIFNLDLGETNFTNGEIIVTDILGKTIYKSEIRSRGVGTKSEINLKGNSSGIYFYRITNENRIVSSGKLILE